MRMIGTLNDEDRAQRFSDFLYAQGIENQIEKQSDGAWAVWVHDEEELERANQLLDEFLFNPEDPRFYLAQSDAKKKREAARREEEAARKRQVDMRSRWARGAGQAAPVTIFLVVASVAVALLSSLGENIEAISYLFITPMTFEGEYVRWVRGLPAVTEFQLWRLVTPIFIHFGVLHIFFNMLWTWDLGRQIEQRQGSWYFGLLVLAVAVPSNLAQFWMVSPLFGGMSGVVFGLFGYIWMRSHFERASAYAMHPNTVTLMVIWFFLCVFGFAGIRAANWVHGVGLGVGMVWGFVASGEARRLLGR